VARQYAGILGLLALMVSLVRGIFAGGASEATLWTAWLSLLAFTVLGAVIGWLAERIVRESVSSRILSDLQEKKPAQRSALPQAAVQKG
jgi:membrane protein implicated in regulation of membrane protease activity